MADMMDRFAALFQNGDRGFDDGEPRITVDKLARFVGLSKTFPITARLQLEANEFESVRQRGGKTWLGFNDALGLANKIETKQATALTVAMFKRYRAVTTPQQRMESLSRLGLNFVDAATGSPLRPDDF